MQGPNVKRLIVHRMSHLAIPDGGGLAAGIAAIMTPGRLGELMKQATAEIEQAIALVKTAPDNPWGDDDEAIAGELLRQIDEQRRARLLGKK